jgi:hypothetical protein
VSRKSQVGVVCRVAAGEIAVGSSSVVMVYCGGGGLLVKQVGFAQEESLASRRVRSGRKGGTDKIRASNYSTTSAGLGHNCGCRLICALCRESEGMARWDDGKKWFE